MALRLTVRTLSLHIFSLLCVLPVSPGITWLYRRSFGQIQYDCGIDGYQLYFDAVALVLINGGNEHCGVCRFIWIRFGTILFASFCLRCPNITSRPYWGTYWYAFCNSFLWCSGWHAYWRVIHSKNYGG
ncbi:hypothetical protein GYMLUDRAFT_394398 [Collybiopsis luxurians FD-317 M1]|uniref:Uncharacterized protein n=1 Tax=Collybiopsis luxurians FD-317 M1 TaxID=944289 RepID=A0A0D0C9I1_9AGAR|nr:hypothetical protein GYMLUDRAFT_394398 [Collybiopsis luxurians FD-317 M1]